MLARPLAGADVLVTGGAGTIGSTLVDQLLDAGAGHIDVLDNFVRGRWQNLDDALRHGGDRVRVVEGDLADRALVHDLVRGKDVVFHQAAIRITQCAEDPRLALEVLVDGSFTVYEAAAAHKVGRVVAASSASVYGLATRFPTHEQHHPYANDTFYGAAKTFTEGMLASFAAMDALNAVTLRYFNVYGPRMDVHGLYTEVLVRWMERIEAGLAPIVMGDGLQTMDFVFVEDVARANVLAATAPGHGYLGAVNVGTGVETSLLELARTLLRVMESPLTVEFAPARGVNGVTRRLADTRKARDELGFVAAVGLEEGLRRLVDWWRAERARAAASATDTADARAIAAHSMGAAR
ncbi:NAD-dependent epimerase/dehydratase family protein [Microbacteriaceae bacterium VKM Ac-2854]|nr:NAD-dependent epimerase/dehydratase family protein [Microbacteriaceae bacterium VKM Ac-2854]